MREEKRRLRKDAKGPAALLVGLLVLLLADVAAAEPRVTLTPASGQAGSAISLNGAGFPASKRIVVKLGRRALARTLSSRSGFFRASAKLPRRTRGRLRIVTSGAGRRVVNVFLVSPSPQFLEAREAALRTGTRVRSKPYRASAGTGLRLSGVGFPRNRRLGITFGRVRIHGGRTSRRGSFATRSTVPSLPQGSYGISVRAGSKRVRLAFEVTVDPVVAAAGDIACDTASPDFNGGIGTADECHMRQTSDLILRLRPTAVLALGDTQYEAGTPPDYRGSYDPTWGRFKPITRPVIGNHEYGHQNGAGYFDYFGPLAGTRPNAYYSFDLGTWHLIALDANCYRPTVSCGAGSAQEQWLRADLGAHSNRCVLAFWHEPLFSSGTEGTEPRTDAFFNALYEARADLLLTGHNHHYERFAPQVPGGVLNPLNGIREFVVGTGGRNLQSFRKTIAPNSEVRNSDTYGVLTLRLHPSSYDWRFVPEAGRSFSDSGSQACH